MTYGDCSCEQFALMSHPVRTGGYFFRKVLQALGLRVRLRSSSNLSFAKSCLRPPDPVRHVDGTNGQRCAGNCSGGATLRSSRRAVAAADAASVVPSAAGAAWAPHATVTGPQPGRAARWTTARRRWADRACTASRESPLQIAVLLDHIDEVGPLQFGAPLNRAGRWVERQHGLLDAGEDHVHSRSIAPQSSCAHPGVKRGRA